jgi:hypothetical protein
MRSDTLCVGSNERRVKTMAATCGTCRAPNQTIAHIRACTGATPSPAVPQLPALVLGNVVTLANEQGFWTVEHVDAHEDGTQWIGVVQHGAPTRTGTTSRTPDLTDVELVFLNEQTATDWRIAQAAEAEKERVAQALHGRPAQESGYYASKHEVRGDAIAGADAVEAPGAQVPAQPAGDVWGPVDELRKQVATHLHYETGQGGSGSRKRQGYFAVRVDGSDTLKFLRIKKMISGRYAGRVFVDSMGSDTGYAVKSPATLSMYLTAVLADPVAAARRFADELGQCSDCGRPLTNEESRARGIGPDCWAKR